MPMWEPQSFHPFYTRETLEYEAPGMSAPQALKAFRQVDQQTDKSHEHNRHAAMLLVKVALRHPVWRCQAIEACPDLFRFARTHGDPVVHALHELGMMAWKNDKKDRGERVEAVTTTIGQLEAIGLKNEVSGSGREPFFVATTGLYDGEARIVTEGFVKHYGPERLNQSRHVDDGSVPLHHAVRLHEKSVEMLLDLGADAFVKDHRDRTPLHWSIDMGRIAASKVLLSRVCYPTGMLKDLLDRAYEPSQRALLQAHLARRAVEKMDDKERLPDVRPL